MAQRTQSAKPVPALVRFAALMDMMAGDMRPRGVADIAQELGLPRSTVHGYCHTLTDLGILSRSSPNEYVIGPHVLAWSAGFDRQNTITQVFAALADETRREHALNLSVLIGRDVMYISCRGGTDPLSVRFREGLYLPAPYTATGKAILATLPDPELTELLTGAWPEPIAPRSVPTLEQLRQELDHARTRGYAIDDGQVRSTLYSCGAAVFTAQSGTRAAAGVSVAIAADHADPRALEAAGEQIADFAGELSRRLGARVR